MGGAFGALTGWLLFAGLALASGAAIARWGVLPRVGVADGPSTDWLHRGAAGVGVAGSLLLLPALAFYFLRQLREFRDPFVPWTEDASLLLGGTPWGTSFVWASVGAVLVIVGLFAARAGRRFGWWLATPVVLALGAFPGLTGHAGGAEELRILRLAADTLHVWAAGGWLGGLAVVLFLEGMWRRSGDPNASLLPELVPAFSRVAMACVATLIVTGSFGAWMELSGLQALWTTGYGRTLLWKLGFVVVVLALGGLNFRVLTPRLGQQGGDRAMRRAAAVELLVAQVVLLITAVLVRTSPMDH